MDQDSFRPVFYSVSELTREIKELLEESFSPLWLQGEISNFTHHSSGHMYFMLKDQEAQIAAVMWRQRNAMLSFVPSDGMQVQVYGQVRVYEKRGNYQFDVLKMVPAGVGSLQLAFEKLKARLQAEGLFDAAHKKPLPLFPQAIGIVTSATGAAIHDMVQVIKRRMPSLQMVLRPTLVQGQGAAEDIAQAIRDFNDYGEVDVLIVGRGGGSLEDLWPFNEEAVARAIYESSIPIVSAVGHEIDFTIADFVADVRAATPSVAAELVSPARTALLLLVDELSQRCRRVLQRSLRSYREKIGYLRSHYGLRRPSDLVLQKRQRLDELQLTIQRSCQNRLAMSRQRLGHCQQLLSSLGPDSILQRGFALCFRAETGELITGIDHLSIGDAMNVQLHDGQWHGPVDGISPGRDGRLPRLQDKKLF